MLCKFYTGPNVHIFTKNRPVNLRVPLLKAGKVCANAAKHVSQSLSCQSSCISHTYLTHAGESLGQN